MINMLVANCEWEAHPNGRATALAFALRSLLFALPIRNPHFEIPLTRNAALPTDRLWSLGALEQNKQQAQPVRADLPLRHRSRDPAAARRTTSSSGSRDISSTRTRRSDPAPRQSQSGPPPAS